MAMTLAQMKVGMSDKVAAQIVDIFLRESEILQNLPFDNCIAQGGVGSTLTYGYIRKILPAVADFRAINAEYTAHEATVEKASVDLKIMGAKFSIDRVLNDAAGQWNNVAYQFEEAVKAVVSMFNFNMIQGDASKSTNGFDGLAEICKDNSQIVSGTAIDLSTASAITTNAGAFYDALMGILADTNGNALLVNSIMKQKIQSVARVLGYKTESEEAFGKRVTKIDGVPIIDMGNHYTVDSSNVTAVPIVPAGSVFAVRFDATDGVCGVTLQGDKGVKVYRPDFNQPGAVKNGEVELVANIAVKNAKAAKQLSGVVVTSA